MKDTSALRGIIDRAYAAGDPINQMDTDGLFPIPAWNPFSEPARRVPEGNYRRARSYTVTAAGLLGPKGMVVAGSGTAANTARAGAKAAVKGRVTALAGGTVGACLFGCVTG